MYAKGYGTLGRHAGPLFESRGLWPATKLSYGGQAERHSAHHLTVTLPRVANYSISEPETISLADAE